MSCFGQLPLSLVENLQGSWLIGSFAYKKKGSDTLKRIELPEVYTFILWCKNCVKFICKTLVQNWEAFVKLPVVGC